jgi:hypothetical protein
MVNLCKAEASLHLIYDKVDVNLEYFVLCISILSFSEELRQHSRALAAFLK